jgi:phosphoglycolate phosphatase
MSRKILLKLLLIFNLIILMIQKNNKKIADFFPGLGYHNDKPLLYYSRKIAISNEYQPINIVYNNIPKVVVGDENSIKSGFEILYLQAKEQLDKINFKEYNNIIFISKSIGTIIAKEYSIKNNIKAYHILYTPLSYTFKVMNKDYEKNVNSIAFTGTKDQWIKLNVVEIGCKEFSIPLYKYENANHSIETGNTLKDIEYLTNIMSVSEKFIKNLI